jgi:hypothetical protein
VSEGPIKRERAAWLPPNVANGSKKDTVHAAGIMSGKTYCGRKSGSLLVNYVPGAHGWINVTCFDCLAGHKADMAERA